MENNELINRIDWILDEALTDKEIKSLFLKEELKKLNLNPENLSYDVLCEETIDDAIDYSNMDKFFEGLLNENK